MRLHLTESIAPKLASRLTYSLCVALVAMFFSRGVVAVETRPAPQPDRDAHWLADIDFIVSQMQATHPNLYHALPKLQFDEALKQLKNRTPSLNDEQAFFEIMRFVARVASERDGHSFIALYRGTKFRALPVELYNFNDGAFVIGASPEFQNLIGCKLKAIEKSPLQDVTKAITPYITKDNDSTLNARVPFFMTCAEMLHVLGIAPDAENVRFVFEDKQGKEVGATLTPVPAVPFWNSMNNKPLPADAPLYMQRPKEPYWFETLPDGETVYMKYFGVRNGGDEVMYEFADRLVKFIDEKKIKRLIIDVRLNGGGNNFLNKHLVKALSECKRINQPGRLFVITGRDTFSAAMNFTTDMERQTKAIFAGEPPGGSPNMYGDAKEFTAPNSGIVLHCSSKYWEKSTPNDSRLLQQPQIPCTLSSDDYFSHRDPVLEAVLKYKK